MPLPSSASYNGMIAAPGSPNTRSTPSARTHCRTIAAPLSIHDLFRLWLRGFRWLLRFAARQPAHHAAQLCTDYFDRMLLLFLAQRGEVVAAVLVFFDPLAGESSVLNVGESFLHRGPRGIAHHFLAARQIAILRGVRDGVAHPSQTAFVDEVDDELHLVQALEVSDLGGVAGFDQ